jgi:hypothetical protein
MGEEGSSPQQRPNTPCSPDELKRLIMEIGNLLHWSNNVDPLVNGFGQIYLTVKYI